MIAALAAGSWAFGPAAPFLTWTVRLGPAVSTITTTIGPLPVSIGLTYFDTVLRPPGTGSGQVRPVSSFQFPKAPAK